MYETCVMSRYQWNDAVQTVNVRAWCPIKFLLANLPHALPPAERLSLTVYSSEKLLFVFCQKCIRHHLVLILSLAWLLQQNRLGTNPRLAVVNTNMTELLMVLREMKVSTQPCQSLAARSVSLAGYFCEYVDCLHILCPTTSIQLKPFQYDLCAEKCQFTNFLKIIFLQMMVVNARRLHLLGMSHR